MPNDTCNVIDEACIHVYDEQPVLDLVVPDLSVIFMRFFFFQAEDGIRDSSVTGVQTCALPISSFRSSKPHRPNHAPLGGFQDEPQSWLRATAGANAIGSRGEIPHARSSFPSKIGRASCRERV